MMQARPSKSRTSFFRIIVLRKLIRLPRIVKHKSLGTRQSWWKKLAAVEKQAQVFQVSADLFLANRSQIFSQASLVKGLVLMSQQRRILVRASLHSKPQWCLSLEQKIPIDQAINRIRWQMLLTANQIRSKALINLRRWICYRVHREQRLIIYFRMPLA